jgi:hypothetical protein
VLATVARVLEGYRIDRVARPGSQDGAVSKFLAPRDV